MIKDLARKDCLFIFKHNYIGHLAYISLNRPCIIPMTYYFHEKENTIICYSGEGHKINAMRKNNSISLEVAEIDSVNNWKSVVAHGSFKELKGIDAKSQLHAFSLGVQEIIMAKEKRDLNFISEFSAKIYKEEVPIVFLIKIDEITGKKRKACPPQEGFKSLV